MSDRLAYSIADAASVMGVSPITIRRAIKDNFLTARYSGAKPLIPAKELERWLQSLPTERK